MLFLIGSLLVYNDFNVSDTTELNPALFDDPEFMEIFRSFFVELHVMSSEDDPEHPGYPRIHFGGTMNVQATMFGYVRLTPDNQIRWHFVSKIPVYSPGLVSHTGSRPLETKGTPSGG